MSTGYAELHCRSHFSFLTGASSPEELVVAAHRQGYAALAITDECSLAGVVRAHAAARPEPDQPALLSLIIGSEMRLSLPPAAANRRTGAVAGEGSSEVTGAMAGMAAGMAGMAAGMAAGPATPKRKTRQARQTLSAIPPSAIPPLPASSPLAGLSAGAAPGAAGTNPSGLWQPVHLDQHRPAPCAQGPVPGLCLRSGRPGAQRALPGWPARLFCAADP